MGQFLTPQEEGVLFTRWRCLVGSVLNELRHVGDVRAADGADLEQAGLVAVWKASRTWDPALQKPFPAYVRPAIKRAVMREARKSYMIHTPENLVPYLAGLAEPETLSLQNRLARARVARALVSAAGDPAQLDRATDETVCDACHLEDAEVVERLLGCLDERTALTIRLFYGLG